MYHFTVPMALMDFVPVIFFAVTAVILLRDLYGKTGRTAYALLSAGSINVFSAGFFKALWKLLYAANICDFTALEEMFLPVNSLGLLMVGAALVLTVCRKGKGAALSVAPAVFSGSFAFIAMMVLGLGGMCVGLSILSARLKKGWVRVLFLLSFVCAMGMGFMSGQDTTQAWVNWTEQGINCVSQLALMAGTILLHRAGLNEQKL